MTRGRAIAALAVLYVLFALPGHPAAFNLLGLAHIPWEPAVLLLLPGFLPPRIWRWVKSLLVALVTVALVVKIANIGTWHGFDRPFAPLTDVPLIPVALGTLAMNSVLIAVAAAAGAVSLIAAIAASVWWALTILGAFSLTRRWGTVTGALTVVTLVLSLVTVGDPPAPVANVTTTRLMGEQTATFVADVRDLRRFKTTLLQPETPPQPRALASLQGVDVLVIFVESYGRSALERAPYDTIVRPTLEESGRALAERGFQASSAWLTSATFGGQSWLAHSTVMSGLPVTSDARYQALVRSKRSTLVADFKRAGWRTAVVMAEITGVWPEGRFFGFDATYTNTELGYRGPPFGYMTMSDQYVLHAFNQRELAKPSRPPLMAEIGLISSHIPWAPLPKLVPWDEVGDGAIFATARTTEPASEVWSVSGGVELAYARSLEYVLRTVTSFITTYGKDNTLVILMGDHQPMGFIAGEGAGRQVPVHVIARDEKLLRALDGGAWALGMTPAADGPVTPMEALRGRILSAFTPKD